MGRAFGGDMAGQRFGRLLVLRKAIQSKEGEWICRCDCGIEKSFAGRRLRSGNTKSCGCYQRDVKITHGLHAHPFYALWVGIRERCLNPKAISYKNYGGRGILMNPKWEPVPNGFLVFFEEMKALGPRPSSKHSLDRKENDKGYFIENLQWATRSEQMKNRRKFQCLSNFSIEELREELAIKDSRKDLLEFHAHYV